MIANRLDRKKSGVYGIINKTNNKIYVGRAEDIHRRIKAHITNLNTANSNQENPHLINSWTKYGRKNFIYVVLEYCDIEDLCKKEVYYIRLYNSIDREFGYNLRIDEEEEMICSEETKEKMSISRNLREQRFPGLSKEVGGKVSEFWKNNPDSKLEMAKNVSDKHRIYKIAKLDLTSKNILSIFESKFDLKETHPDYYYQAILGCCQGNKKSYKGFGWCYLDRNTNQKIIK